ncbi:MAG: tricarboxylate transporter [Eubacteriaceae bacterium]|nr:tricarboxylate transporter [Eubacteriaceae bacterium]
MNKKASIAGAAVFLIIGIIILFAKPFLPALSDKGHYVISMLIITIGLWIFRPFAIPLSVSGAFFMASALVIGIPAKEVFSGFSTSAVWTLIPALFFGFALAKTGLGKRIAYFGMKITTLSYGKLLLMWALIGIALSALTPSINVRVVIITPIALNCVDILKLEKGSKERSLILLSAFAMAIIPGTGWITGSLNGPVINGLYTAVPQLGAITFNEWLKVSLLPAGLISVLTLVLGYFTIKPSKPLKLSKEIFIEEYNKLGSPSKQEKVTGLILTLSFIMFVTNSIHHVPDAATCLIALFLLTAFGIVKLGDVGSGISWDLVIFIGTAMGLSAIFTQSGVSGWLSSILLKAISPVCVSPWLFIYATLIAMFLLRFIDIASFIPTMAVLMSVIPQLSASYGINPLVWIPLFTIAINAFFLNYQNMFALVAESNFENNGWVKKHFSIYGCVYFVACMIAMLFAIPYYMAIGMF